MCLLLDSQAPSPSHLLVAQHGHLCRPDCSPHGTGQVRYSLAGQLVLPCSWPACLDTVPASCPSHLCHRVPTSSSKPFKSLPIRRAPPSEVLEHLFGCYWLYCLTWGDTVLLGYLNPSPIPIEAAQGQGLHPFVPYTPQA